MPLYFCQRKTRDRGHSILMERHQRLPSPPLAQRVSEVAHRNVLRHQGRTDHRSGHAALRMARAGESVLISQVDRKSRKEPLSKESSCLNARGLQHRPNREPTQFRRRADEHVEIALPSGGGLSLIHKLKVVLLLRELTQNHLAFLSNSPLLCTF